MALKHTVITEINGALEVLAAPRFKKCEVIALGPKRRAIWQ